jgi:hypothetical protein
MSSSCSGGGEEVRTDRSLMLRLDDFAWEAIEEEAAREGLTTEELVAFSVLYYVADVDSGRISRQISRSPYPRLLNDHSGSRDRQSAAFSVHPVTDPGRRPSGVEESRSPALRRDS